MPKKWYTSQITRTADASSTTRRFWLSPPVLEGAATVENFTFRAGQFLTLDLPIGEKRRERWRSYSIASAPGEALELCIVQLDGGRGTQYLFEEAEVGTSLRFKGPDGMFTLPETVTQDLVFICTGTGVAPFRSMLKDLLASGRPHGELHLIFGTRRAEGILYQKEFQELAAAYPQFHYYVALSREADLDPAAFPFPVYQGYVHQIYEQLFGTPNENRRFYLCGWSNMVDQAQARLLELGYAPQQVVVELYG
ncbi:MAG: FAD-dependent oxidoreductase [Bacteroidota bacterium]